MEKVTAVDQKRLVLGPFELVPVEPPHAGRPTLWALPGGGHITTADALAIAHRNEWKRPTVIDVLVRHRAEVS